MKNGCYLDDSNESIVVEKVLKDVKFNGDNAILKYNKKFDNVKIKNFRISKKQIKEAYNKVDKEVINAIKKAAKNIEYFAKKQFKQYRSFEVKTNGVILGQKVVPIEKAGCYVPGGIYPYPSSALMSVIPAKIAGVKEIIVCSPKIKPVTIVAANIAGADKIYNIGGIQAIAAMAYGTKKVPKVDKIVGPGNRFVTAAKRKVYGIVGIDFLAGPSEVMVIADKSGNPKFIAADLLAQAEHDANSRTDLITTSKRLADEVNKQMKIQLTNLKTEETAKLALKNNRIIVVTDLDKAVNIANIEGPEHLILQVKSPKRIMKKLICYGSLFIGKYTAEVFGDYCSGTNHILPTNRAARYTGGLSVKDFVKILTYQKIDKKGANQLIKISSKLAEIEGLDGHKKAAEIRISTSQCS